MDSNLDVRIIDDLARQFRDKIIEPVTWLDDWNSLNYEDREGYRRAVQWLLHVAPTLGDAQ